MPDEGDSIEPLSIHERYEVRAVGQYADRSPNSSCGSPPSQIHRQDAPAREPFRFQFLGERAEGVGAPR